MSTRALAYAAGVPLAAVPVGAYAFGRWWAGAVQRLLDTPIGEREARASNNDLKDVRT